MHLVFDIFQGIGVAAAVGVRPFLPGLVTGALAAAGAELSFAHTKFDFLAQTPFLLAMLVGVIVVAMLERRLLREESGAWGPSGIVLALCGLAVGALLCGGAFARTHHHGWAVIGIVVGVICAAIGVAATRPLLVRVRARLDADAAGVLPAIVEGAAAVGAALSVLAPPVGVILVAALLWLLIAGRGGGDRKYAGLRILR
jgi:hypothetical protein